jgi:hypothetical protein
MGEKEAFSTNGAGTTVYLHTSKEVGSLTQNGKRNQAWVSTL